MPIHIHNTMADLVTSIMLATDIRTTGCVRKVMIAEHVKAHAEMFEAALVAAWDADEKDGNARFEALRARLIANQTPAIIAAALSGN